MSALTGLQIGDAPQEKPAVAPAHMVPSPTGGQMLDPSKEVTPAPKPNEVEKPGERPAWLPEKFKTAEDMAKAYGELETKLGKPAEKTPVTPPADTAGLDMNALEQEWTKTEGKLSDATVAALKAKGLTPDLIGKYVSGQQAEVAAARAEFTKIAGDEATLEAILKWAPANLTQAEASAYDKAINSGDAQTAKLLFESIAARYVAANGKEPNLVTGATVPGATGAQPFESWDQVVALMSDKRYKTGDLAYIKKVHDRLAVSPALG